MNLFDMLQQGKYDEVINIISNNLDILTDRQKSVISMLCGLQDNHQHSVVDVAKHYNMETYEVRMIRDICLQKISNKITGRKPRTLDDF